MPGRIDNLDTDSCRDINHIPFDQEGVIQRSRSRRHPVGECEIPLTHDDDGLARRGAGRGRRRMQDKKGEQCSEDQENGIASNASTIFGPSSMFVFDQTLSIPLIPLI